MKDGKGKEKKKRLMKERTITRHKGNVAIKTYTCEIQSETA